MCPTVPSLREEVVVGHLPPRLGDRAMTDPTIAPARDSRPARKFRNQPDPMRKLPTHTPQKVQYVGQRLPSSRHFSL